MIALRLLALLLCGALAVVVRAAAGVAVLVGVYLNMRLALTFWRVWP